jgi:hypothetical protein
MSGAMAAAVSAAIMLGRSRRRGMSMPMNSAAPARVTCGRVWQPGPDEHPGADCGCPHDHHAGAEPEPIDAETLGRRDEVGQAPKRRSGR